MNENASLIGESYVLGCGDTIECNIKEIKNRLGAKQFPTQWESYHLVVQNRVIFAAADKELFDLLHDPMLKMFQKLFFNCFTYEV